jgi:hypothetical protein
VSSFVIGLFCGFFLCFFLNNSFLFSSSFNLYRFLQCLAQCTLIQLCAHVQGNGDIARDFLFS